MAKHMKKYKRAYIEVTNICNMSCSFCPIEERQKSNMSLEDFEKTIKQVSPISEQVCLHLMGEPLAHPDFDKILDICNDYRAKVQITTNGLLLRKMGPIILKSETVRQVNVSVQSYMDNFPERDLSTYLDQIFEFVEKSFEQRSDLYLNIRLWNIEDDKGNENEVVFRYFEDKFNIAINRNLELGRIKSKHLINKLYFHFDSRFEWPRMDLPFQSKNGRCNGLIDHFAIHNDGSVVPCCLDDQKILNLGNVLETSLTDILSSQRAINISEGFKQNQLREDLCQKCSYINRFKK